MIMAKPILGVGVTTGGLGGYTPQVNHTGFIEIREKRLFFSQREAGLFIPKTLRGGYGELEAGTILAEDTNTGFLVPYIPDDILATDVGRIMLAADHDVATTFKIWAEDRGKLKVGDVVVLTDSDDVYEEATVSGVALDANGRTATVTVSAATTTVGGFTVAKSGNAYLKAGASGKRSTAKYVLDQDQFTGDFDNPNGGLTSVFLSNGIIYKDSLVGADATALSALSGVVDGQFVIFK
jgi:hypothetical protein